MLRRDVPELPPINNFQCAWCLERFQTIDGLRAHTAVAHNGDFRAVCSAGNCMKMFANPCNYEAHINTKNRCPSCCFAPKSRSDLMRHCGYSACQISNMEKHMQICCRR